MSAWVQRNRVGLALLPIALLAAAAGNGHRIQTWFWEGDVRAPTTTGADGIARLVDLYDDGHQQHPIRPELSLKTAEPVSVIQPTKGQPFEPKLATGTRLWKVVLAVKADPNMILTGCTVALATPDGTRWSAKDKAFDDGQFGAPDLCTPPGKPGPSWLPNTPAPVVRIDEVRPASYEVTSYLAIPAGAEPTQVWVWWHAPRFAVLDIKR